MSIARKKKQGNKKVSSGTKKEKNRIVNGVANESLVNLSKQGLFGKKVPKEVMKKERQFAEEAYREVRNKNPTGKVTREEVAKKVREKEAKWIKEKN